MLEEYKSRNNLFYCTNLSKCSNFYILRHSAVIHKSKLTKDLSYSVMICQFNATMEIFRFEGYLLILLNNYWGIYYRL